MRFFDSHTILLYLVYHPMLALGIYFLIISSICMFLAFGEESDKFEHNWQMDLNPFVSVGNATPSISRE
jgi:hypothetical protein